MLETIANVFVRLTLGLALSVGCLMVTCVLHPESKWSQYTEEEKSNVAKSLMWLVVMAFMSPWTFG